MLCLDFTASLSACIYFKPPSKFFEVNLHLDTAFVLMGLSDCEHLLIWFLFHLINLVMKLTI